MNAERPCALVTGGAVRIGRSICKALARNNYHVVIHYRSSSADAAQLQEEIIACGGASSLIDGDLCDDDITRQLVQRASEQTGKPISLLVNSASAFEVDSIEDFSDRSWDLHMNMHLKAPMLLAQAFAAQTHQQFNNQIINIIDQRVWALTPKFFSYTLSKAALWTATQTLAQALGPQQIRVNAIGPGPTMRNKRQSEEDWQRQNNATILGHGARPEEIADALLYLVNAKSVTGQMIAVDGGQHLAWETPDVLVDE